MTKQSELKKILEVVNYYFKTDEFGNVKLRGIYTKTEFVQAILKLFEVDEGKICHIINMFVKSKTMSNRPFDLAMQSELAHALKEEMR